MALPGSGAISFNNCNTEFSRTATAQLDLNDGDIRLTFKNVISSATQISLSEGYGKSYATDSWTSAGSENILDTTGGGPASTSFAAWYTQINVTTSANTITAPDGGSPQRADYIYSTGATSLILRGYFNTGSNGPLYCSIYAQKNTSDVFTLNCYYDDGVEYNTTFDLTNRTISGNTSGAGMQRATTGATPWYRCWQVVPFTSGRVNLIYRVWPAGRNDGVSRNGLGCNFWGAQINTGSVKNLYMPYGQG